MNIEYLPVESLRPYERNARKHSDADVNAIVASIREFGFNDPIGICGDVIVEGHGRLLAAKKLGMDEVPCIRLDHLSDEQRRAYALAHNRTAELSEWDFDIQAAELADITNIDMRNFGFYPGDNDLNFDLDADDFAEEKTVVRLVFEDYKSYSIHEKEIKEFAADIGAQMTIGK